MLENYEIRDKMDAIGINAFGDANQLQMMKVDVPTINDDQILIKVRSTGINPIDWKTREGLRQQRYDFNFPIILGQEMAGVIVQVGKNVKDFKPNDQVLGYGVPSEMGTYAQYYAMDAKYAAKFGNQISFAEASGIAMTGTTAYEALFTYGKLLKGQTVLILAGSGGVGSLAIQLAKNAGAKVITTTGTSNIDYVKSIGADEVVDYKNDNLVDKVQNVDLVFDTLGGQNQVDAFKAVKTGGTIVSIVEQTDQAVSLSKLYNITFHKIVNRPDHDTIIKLAQLISADKLHVRIADDLPFTLDNAKKLQNHSQTGHTDGKLVMTLQY